MSDPMSSPARPPALHQLNAWRELGEELLRVRTFLTAEQSDDLFPDWFWPQVSRLLASVSPPNLFKSGLFTLHSGQETNWKIDCDALTDQDWQTLARMAVHILPPFGGATGVPSGGLKFAAALQEYVTDGPIVIADDVLTTGASMEELRVRTDTLGVVVFARGPVPSWIRPLFQFDSSSIERASVSPPEEQLRRLVDDALTDHAESPSVNALANYLMLGQLASVTLPQEEQK